MQWRLQFFEAAAELIVGLLENHDSELKVESMIIAYVGSLYELGVGLIIIGIVFLILAIVLIVIPRGKSGGKVKAAGVIIVGPVPIIIGSDKKSVKAILVLSIVLTAMVIVAMLVYYFLLR